jgi:phage-related tail protein
MSDLKGPMTTLVQKLTTSTARALNSLHEFNLSLQDFHATLQELAGRVAHVENLEGRAAAATSEFDNATRQLQANKREMEEVRTNLDQLLAEVSVPAAKMHEIRTMLKSM